MVNPHVFDSLDARIVQALQLDGRASFRALAGVLDVSPQTVARRYAALHASGGLRVLGRSDTAPDRTRWLVRLRSTPDASSATAQAIARRPDTTFVALASGGTEVVCVTEGQPGTETPLLRQLPHTPRIVDVRAHQLLRVLYGGRDGWYAKLGALNDHQVAILHQPHRTPTVMDTDSVDERLLSVLHRDGRVSAAVLGAASGLTESAARRRVQRLRDSGHLYFDLQLHPATLGYRHTTLLWLTCSPARTAALADALAAHPEVAFAAATTGPTAIVVALICRTADDLYRYLTGSLAPLPGVVNVETTPILRHVKHLTTDIDGYPPTPIRN